MKDSDAEITRVGERGAAQVEYALAVLVSAALMVAAWKMAAGGGIAGAILAALDGGGGDLRSWLWMY